MNEDLPPPGFHAAFGLDHEPHRGLLAAATLSGPAHDLDAGRHRDLLAAAAFRWTPTRICRRPWSRSSRNGPGRAAEEVERLITVPVEREMNGIPRMTTIRSISLYGLSDVILTFPERHRQLFRAPAGVQPFLGAHAAERREPVPVADVGALGPHLPVCAAKPGPLADGTQDLRGLDGRAAVQIRAGRGRRFRVRRRNHAVPGAARSRPGGLGGLVGLRRSRAHSRPTTTTPAADSIRRAASSTTCAGSDAWTTLEDIGNVVLAVHDGSPRAGQGCRPRRRSASRRAWASSATRSRTMPSRASSCCVPERKPRTY